METKQPTLDLTRKYHLGPRAFYLFFSKRVKLPIFMLMILAAYLFWGKQFVPIEWGFLADYIVKLWILLFSGVLTFKIFRTFFEYKGYAYKFEDEFFLVTRGYFVKHEYGIVYHQIQNVNIKRDLFDRGIGVSQLIIVMSSAQSGPNRDLLLPALDRHRAKMLQQELLKQARKHMMRGDEPALKQEVARPLV